MTSQKQIAANQANAQASTGPISEQGKQVSRMNALRHGLTAKQVVIEGEDPDELDRLLEALFNQFTPQTALEAQFVEQLGGYLWRARRIPALEAAIFKALQQGASESRGHFELSREQDNKPRVSYSTREETIERSSESYLRALRLREKEKENEYAKQAGIHVGHGLLRDASADDALAKLSRYEVHILNSVERIIRQLEKIGKQRDAAETGNRGSNDLELVADTE